ncbi:MAG: hypothetical protein A2905_01680 [Candidatus Levybacteria bacterium RIFCSPLOWO2_01_FULL_36_10]|nr:MAG: hypothetical protein A2905_01680 [Candidatus Levybacteria bacterium RIFCSPLOWO2_01_FULL_36_10]
MVEQKRKTFIRKKKTEKKHTEKKKVIKRIAAENEAEKKVSPVVEETPKTPVESAPQVTPLEVQEKSVEQPPVISAQPEGQLPPASVTEEIPRADLVNISPQNYENPPAAPASNPLQNSTSAPADSAEQAVVQSPAEATNPQTEGVNPEAQVSGSEPFIGLPQEKNNKKLLIFLVITLLIVLGGGAFYVYKNVLNNKTPVKNVVQKVSPSIYKKPTLTPTATLTPPQLTKYSIKVLNGSAISGEAAKVKSMLEKEGFMVSSVGNATNSAFTKTVISAKKTVSQAYLEKLKTDLSSSYLLDNTQVLPDTQTSDVVVTIGSGKALSPTSSK